ncbi:MAG: choice-of-anchor J domain-containing protein, partial [Candidatus Thermoplasmatota archaeon]
DYAAVDISTDGGETWTNLLTWTTDHSPIGPGELVTIDLTPYIGNIVIIRWHYFGIWAWWFEIDNVKITAELQTPHITSSTTIYVNSTDAGLCPVGSVHLHVEVYNASSEQLIYDEWDNVSGSATILSEGFETSVPPPGWTEVIVNDLGTDPDWSWVSSGTLPTCTPHSGSYMAKFNSWNCITTSSARLYTGMLDFSSYSDVVLNFWMYHDTGFSGAGDRIVIQYSLDNSTWNDITTIYRYDGSTGWKQHAVDLSPYVGRESQA